MSPRQQSVDFLENLLTFFGLNVLIEVAEDEEEAVLNLQVPSTHLNGFLIGSNGENLRALQHLTNMALRHNGFENTNAVVDIAGYKRQRSDRLSHEVAKLAHEVLASGQPYSMKPLSAYERRVAHQAVSGIDGVTTESQGEGRDRHIVIKKSDS